MNNGNGNGNGNGSYSWLLITLKCEQNGLNYEGPDGDRLDYGIYNISTEVTENAQNNSDEMEIETPSDNNNNNPNKPTKRRYTEKMEFEAQQLNCDGKEEINSPINTQRRP